MTKIRLSFLTFVFCLFSPPSTSTTQFDEFFTIDEILKLQSLSPQEKAKTILNILSPSQKVYDAFVVARDEEAQKGQLPPTYEKLFEETPTSASQPLRPVLRKLLDEILTEEIKNSIVKSWLDARLETNHLTPLWIVVPLNSTGYHILKHLIEKHKINFNNLKFLYQGQEYFSYDF